MSMAATGSPTAETRLGFGRIVSGFTCVGRLSLENQVERSRPAVRATAEFGRQVKARRNELGLSQEALADIARLHLTFVAGRARPAQPEPCTTS